MELNTAERGPSSVALQQRNFERTPRAAGHSLPSFSTDFSTYYMFLSITVPIPVAVLSKEQVCGRLLAEIVGSNPTGGMDVCLL